MAVLNVFFIFILLHYGVNGDDSSDEFCRNKVYREGFDLLRSEGFKYCWKFIDNKKTYSHSDVESLCEKISGRPLALNTASKMSKLLNFILQYRRARHLNDNLRIWLSPIKEGKWKSTNQRVNYTIAMIPRLAIKEDSCAVYNFKKGYWEYSSCEEEEENLVLCEEKGHDDKRFPHYYPNEGPESDNVNCSIHYKDRFGLTPSDFCWRMISRLESMSNAVRFCASHRGRLITVDEPYTAHKLQSYIQAYQEMEKDEDITSKGYAWLSPIKNGRWETTGEKVSMLAKDPNSKTTESESCVKFEVKTGKWEYAECKGTALVVCEKKNLDAVIEKIQARRSTLPAEEFTLPTTMATYTGNCKQEIFQDRYGIVPEGKCLRLIDVVANYTEANAMCKKMQGHLFYYNTYQMQLAVGQYMADYMELVARKMLRDNKAWLANYDTTSPNADASKDTYPERCNYISFRRDLSTGEYRSMRMRSACTYTALVMCEENKTVNLKSAVKEEEAWTGKRSKQTCTKSLGYSYFTETNRCYRLFLSETVYGNAIKTCAKLNGILPALANGWRGVMIRRFVLSNLANHTEADPTTFNIWLTEIKENIWLSTNEEAGVKSRRTMQDQSAEVLPNSCATFDIVLKRWKYTSCKDKAYVLCQEIDPQELGTNVKHMKDEEHVEHEHETADETSDDSVENEDKKGSLIKDPSREGKRPIQTCTKSQGYSYNKETNHCWKMFTHYTDFQSANKTCADLNGHLPALAHGWRGMVIRKYVLLYFAYNLGRAATYDIWVSDIKNNVWASTNEEVRRTDFMQDPTVEMKPNSCATFNLRLKRWKYTSCKESEKAYFLCEENDPPEWATNAENKGGEEYEDESYDEYAGEEEEDEYYGDEEAEPDYYVE